MKAQKVVFGGPVKVLQVFRNINIYTKEERSFENRKAVFEWTECASGSGFVRNGELFLPKGFPTELSYKTCHLITLEDDIQTEWRGFTFRTHQNRLIHLIKPYPFDIFKIKDKDRLELALQYSYQDIGQPSRDNFKICTLTSDLPIELRINGKRDSSGSLATGRTFNEFQYIFQYHGEFESARLLNENEWPVTKKRPQKVKKISLLKPLW